ncbi:hypothetical protein AB0D04_40835 [Streptomyces sp. NPDC048483]|uniref:hypothetical protein n=1 Tax=Streptomyces sp. NPDC048483 TaxID=3154927 RepID=UPI00341759E8
MADLDPDAKPLEGPCERSPRKPEGLAVGGPYWLGEYRRMVVVPVLPQEGLPKEQS